jgi:hypothetical protein
MSNEPAFTITVRPFEADADGGCPAFTSTTLVNHTNTVSISGFEHEDGRTHVTGYLHKATGVRVEAGLTNDGEPSVRIAVKGDVTTYVTIFGVSLADLLVAAAEAVKDAS